MLRRRLNERTIASHTVRQLTSRDDLATHRFGPAIWLSKRSPFEQLSVQAGFEEVPGEGPGTGCGNSETGRQDPVRRRV